MQAVLSDPKVLVFPTIRCYLENEFQILDRFPIAVLGSICKVQVPCFCCCFANAVGQELMELLPLCISGVEHGRGMFTGVLIRGISSLFCGLPCSLGDSGGLVPRWNHPGNGNSKNCEAYCVTDTERVETQPRT